MSVGNNRRAYVERARSSKKEESQSRTLNIGRWSDCVPSRGKFHPNSIEPARQRSSPDAQPYAFTALKNRIYCQRRRAICLLLVFVSSMISDWSRDLFFTIATGSRAFLHSISCFLGIYHSRSYCHQRPYMYVDVVCSTSQRTL